MNLENKPLVSVITITYNRGDLIHRCIESIQKQTYPNYEHIIVDGNSTDNTKEVVESYADPHIKYIKLNTKGPEVQMRAGSEIARGKYITFLDDDDEYLPEKLTKQVELFEQEPEDVGIVYCWMSYYKTNAPTIPFRIHKTELKGFVGDIAPSKPLISGTPTMMLRKEIFNEFGGAFDDNIGLIMSDWEFMARVCQKYKVDYVPESLVNVYVDHGHKRLSTDFYQNKARKGIIFHTHFLKCFADVFEKHPRYAEFHYDRLCVYYSILAKRKEAFHFWKQYAKVSKNYYRQFKLFCRIILGK